MPSLGADMDEGTLVEWLVAPGDAVHRGDIVAVVDTAKSAIEIEVFEDREAGRRAGEVAPRGAAPPASLLAASAAFSARDAVNHRASL